MKEEMRNANIQKLGQLLTNFSVVMLTTLQPRDGSLHSRPMMAQANPEFDGQIWFFSRYNSAKVDEIRAGSQVNLAYADAAGGRYLSVSGTAYIEQDHAKMRELWSESYRTWFANGLDEINLALLRIEVQSADVWDAAGKLNGEVLHLA